jgi:uncharacterized phage-associated protein
MALPSSAVADYFLELAKRDSIPITPLKLQKLVYFAHGWYLGLTAEPLLNEKVQAWKYGPVIPSLYHEFKEFGNAQISRNSGNFRQDDLTSPGLLAAKELLDRIWAVYSKYTPSQLSALSHETNGPWRQVLAQAPPGPLRSVEIPDETMRQFFTGRLRKN